MGRGTDPRRSGGRPPPTIWLCGLLLPTELADEFGALGRRQTADDVPGLLGWGLGCLLLAGLPALDSLNHVGGDGSVVEALLGADVHLAPHETLKGNHNRPSSMTKDNLFAVLTDQLREVLGHLDLDLDGRLVPALRFYLHNLHL